MLKEDSAMQMHMVIRRIDWSDRCEVLDSAATCPGVAIGEAR